MNGESAAAGTTRREAPPAEAAHVLVVDDDDRLRTLLGRYLRDNGYHVSSASSAADARAKLDGMAFDLIVLDVMMPGESGIDFTRAGYAARPRFRSCCSRPWGSQRTASPGWRAGLTIT